MWDLHRAIRSSNRLILNFSVTFNYVVVFFYFITFLLLHESTLTLYSNMGDALSRFFVNDFFVNSYYLLWTSFWYLPTFLIISFSLVLINFAKSGTGYVWLLLGLVLVAVSLHYQNLNLYNYLLDNYGTNFNTLLSNSVNKFHPALFYITITHILLASQLSLFNRRRLYVLNTNSAHTTYVSNSLIPIIIFTLFLGSWWALQEGSWGGWWNWDPSEVFGLFVLLYYLYTLHKSQKVSNYPVQALYLKILTQLVFVVYVFIQLNFDLVSHNFGTKVDQFIDTYQNFLTLVVLLVLFIVIISRYLLYTIISTLVTSPWHATRVKEPILLWHISGTVALGFILLSSFSLLINDFLWQLLSLNIFNSTKFTYFYTSLLITITLLRSWTTQSYIILVLLYLPYFGKETILLLIVPAVARLSILHLSLISLLFVMLSESNQSISFWEILYENMSYTQADVVYDVSSPFVALNNFMTEYLLTVLANNKTFESIWNFTWTASSNEGHSFLHSIMADLLTQSLYAGNGLSTYLVNVVDFCISTTNVLTTLLLLGVGSLLKTPKLITS